jgi:lipopolysaccharide heptosyltransferase II
MKKIIVTPLIGLGDVLMSTPALELLKKSMPDAWVTYCAMNKATHEVLKGNPYIDKLVLYPMLGPNKPAAMFQLLRECTLRYSVSLNFYPSNRLHYNLFSLLTLAPQRIGHRYLRMNFSQANWLKTRTIAENDSLHCVEENVALLPLLGVDVAGAAIPNLRLYLDKKECEEGLAFRRKTAGGLPLIGVHAGTSVFKGHAARRWPKERFAELIRRIPDAHFLLFGTAEEEEANRHILEAAAGSSPVTLVNDTTIRQAASIIRACDFFISNDSGLMHVAAAVGTPVVAVIGPTNPVYIHPWGVEHRVITAPTPCRHCFHYSPKPLRCSSKNQFECLTELPVDKVELAAREFLGKFAGSGIKKGEG